MYRLLCVVLVWLYLVLALLDFRPMGCICHPADLGWRISAPHSQPFPELRRSTNRGKHPTNRAMLERPEDSNFATRKRHQRWKQCHQPSSLGVLVLEEISYHDLLDVFGLHPTAIPSLTSDTFYLLLPFVYDQC